MNDKSELSTSLKSFLNKAADALRKDNYPYAITLLSSVIETAPDHNEARSLLRLAELKQFEKRGNPRIKKIVAVPFVLYYLLKIYFNKQKDDGAAILKNCEKAFNKDPQCSLVLTQMGETALKIGNIQLAVDSFEQIRRQSPGNIRALKTLARIYLDNKELDKARRYFEEIIHLSPNDNDAGKGIKDIAAMKTIETGGWDDTDSSYRSKIKDEKQAGLYEKEARIGRSKEDINALIDKLEKEIENQPENVTSLKILAELYAEKEDFDSSLKTYEKAVSVTPNDFTLRELITEVKTLKLDGMIHEKENIAQPTSENEKAVKGLKEQKAILILDERKQRVVQYPNNLTYRYDLGESYFKISKIDEAIEQFQYSVNEPRRRVASLNYLGLCFHQKKLYDLSAKQFEKALESLYDMDSVKKEIVYNLGLLFEDAEKPDKALNQFQIIYEVDIGYKDVRQKIEKK
ncbi:MAG: tetratricopeptide repeat protein [Candidatus Theseobacter exili]|nr:tetratricopeptide repeat protein [Candidatus Theseobacter exili]